MRARHVPVTVRKRAGCISLLARFPMKVEGVLDVSRRGYPATTAFSLNPGIGGIGCDIAAGGVHKVKPCSSGIYSHLLSVGADGGGYINLLCTNKDDLSL